MLTPAVTEIPAQLIRLDGPALAEGSSAPISARALFGLDLKALQAVMIDAAEPPWRASQLAEALYRQRIADLDLITTLPKALRQRLSSEGWQVGRPRIAQIFHSSDGTERYLVESQAGDAQTVETVWMPEGDGGDEAEGGVAEDVGTPSARATICVSSQVGCAVNCQFCLTARLGLQRNLTAGEIAGQVVAVLDRHAVQVGRSRVNLVFMGMGEPFLNYENFMAAVRLLVNETGLSPQRMTVSTSGIVPGIERFAQEPPELRPRLAISLNAPSDDLRSELMPINRKWPISAVIDAARRLPLRPRERITFEYVLLGGLNDRPQDATQLARLARRSGLPLKINLIAWNPGPGIAYATPQPHTVEAFRNALAAQGLPVYLRKPRGRDIFAACGQLKRTVES